MIDWTNPEACRAEVRHTRDECARVRGLYEEQVRRAEKAEDQVDELEALWWSTWLRAWKEIGEAAWLGIGPEPRWGD